MKGNISMFKMMIPESKGFSPDKEANSILTDLWGKYRTVLGKSIDNVVSLLKDGAYKDVFSEDMDGDIADCIRTVETVARINSDYEKEKNNLLVDKHDALSLITPRRMLEGNEHLGELRKRIYDYINKVRNKLPQSRVEKFIIEKYMDQLLEENKRVPASYEVIQFQQEEIISRIVWSIARPVFLSLLTVLPKERISDFLDVNVACDQKIYESVMFNPDFFENLDKRDKKVWEYVAGKEGLEPPKDKTLEFSKKAIAVLDVVSAATKPRRIY